MARPLKVGAVMYDPKVSVIWEIIRDFFDAQGAPIDVAFYSTYEVQVGGLLDRHDRHRLELAAGLARRAAPIRRRAAAPSPCATPIATASRTSWRGAAVRCGRWPT